MEGSCRACVEARSAKRSHFQFILGVRFAVGGELLCVTLPPVSRDPRDQHFVGIVRGWVKKDAVALSTSLSKPEYLVVEFSTHTTSSRPDKVQRYKCRCQATCLYF
jgi:sensor domain CHASE-containing protein